MRGNPHNYEAGFTIEQHRDELIDRLGKAITALAAKDEQIAALKSTIASLLSIDDSKVAEYVVLSPEALQAAAGNRVAELEAKVRRLEAPFKEGDAYALAMILTAMHEGVQPPAAKEVAVAMNAIIAARSTPPAKETE